MIIAARVYVFELARLVITLLGVGAVEQEAFDFVRRVESVTFAFEQIVGVCLEHAANISCIRRSAFIDHVPKTNTLPGPKISAGAQ